MSKLPKIQSLELFRYESKQLHKSIQNGCTHSVIRAVNGGFRGEKLPGLKACAKIVADEYGYAYRDLINTQNLMVQYVYRNLEDRHWRLESLKRLNPQRYLRQIEVILDSIKRKVPLEVAARQKGESFVGFHFSDLLYYRLFNQLNTWPMVDLAGIDARQAIIHEHWMGGSFAGANLEDAKFYRTYGDPAVGPGVVAPDTDFSNANLKRADLRCSYIKRCNFRNASLEGADLRRATIDGSMFEGSEGKWLSGGSVNPKNWVIFKTPKKK